MREKHEGGDEKPRWRIKNEVREAAEGRHVRLSGEQGAAGGVGPVLLGRGGSVQEQHELKVMIQSWFWRRGLARSPAEAARVRGHGVPGHAVRRLCLLQS